MKNHYKVLFGLIIYSIATNAQDIQNQTVVNDSSIQGQFEILIRRSSNYRQDDKRYEVVRLIELNALQNNVLDSLKTSKKTIGDLNNTIGENESTINSLTAKLNETSTNLKDITQEKDSMSFFGILISKSSYKVTVWSIIFVLTTLLLFFIFKFKNSNTLTQQAKSALTDLNEEYEQHRRKALEREQKINRELHDERNKNRKKT